MSYKVIIDAKTELASNSIKDAIVKAFPYLDGHIHIHKEPEITTLDKAIEETKKKGGRNRGDSFMELRR